MRRNERDIVVVDISICVRGGGGVALLTCFAVRGFNFFAVFEGGGAGGRGDITFSAALQIAAVVLQRSDY